MNPDEMARVMALLKAGPAGMSAADRAFLVRAGRRLTALLAQITQAVSR